MTRRPRPLDVREWLEDMRRYVSLDGERATELLKLLDERDDLQVWHELEWSFDEVRAACEQIEALQALCEKAGLIEPGDVTTDVIPLLRMFLPSS